MDGWRKQRHRKDRDRERTSAASNKSGNSFCYLDRSRKQQIG